jgi:hypothetical protein
MRATTLIIATTFLVAAVFWLMKPKTAVPAEAQEAVKEATAKAEIATHAATAVENKAIAARPKVKIASEAAKTSTETRIASNISIDDLPQPVTAEFNAMINLIETLQTQLDFEIQRGDAWQDAALAQNELITTLQEQQASLIKATRWKGLKWGAVIGAVGVILLVVLI